MRILSIIGYRFPTSWRDPLICGAQAQPVFQFVEMARRGIEVCVMTRRGPDEPPAQEFNGVQVRRYVSWSHVGGDRQTTSLSLHRLALLKRTIEEFEPEVAIVITPLGFERRILRKSGVPYIYVNHGVSGNFVRNLGWSLADMAGRAHINLISVPLHRATARNAALVIGVCQQDLDILHDRDRIPMDKLRLIHNGVDTQHFSPTASAGPFYRTHQVPEDAPIVLLVGRFSREKGFHVLADAAEAIIGEVPTTYFVLAGLRADPAYIERLKASIPVPLRSRFVIATDIPQEDLPAYYAAATVCVVPSVGYDPFPGTMLQAMAAGKPLVSSDMPSRRELVKDGHNGLMVAPGDCTALARAVTRLLVDQELGTRLADAGRDLAVRERSLQLCVDKYVDLLAETIGLPVCRTER